MKRKNINYQRIILRTIAAAGLLSVAMVAPNAVQALKILDGGPRKKNPKYYIDISTKRLIDKKLIEKIGNDLQLTKKGENFILFYNAQAKSPSRTWDKKWRIVIYDIPERRKRTRDIVRGHLAGFGFKCLQNSVWIFPYACEELISLLKIYCQVGRDIIYITTEKIENDGQIRKMFSLDKSVI